MKVSIIHDKKIIENHFRKNTDLNIYSIGDLDDFFWDYTKWYALESNAEIKQIVLLYTGVELPTLVAVCDSGKEQMYELLKMILHLLPENIYAHLSPGLIGAFKNSHESKINGENYKMAMKQKNLLVEEKNESIKRLSPKDYDLLKNLYNSSYPENWFDKRMLETGKYFGYYADDKIVGVAGIHVYSPEYKVAALGNITTDVNYRGMSICTKLTTALCNDLLQAVDNIGLNVHKENEIAINCYKKIGFEIIGEYEEFYLNSK